MSRFGGANGWRWKRMCMNLECTYLRGRRQIAFHVFLLLAEIYLNLHRISTIIATVDRMEGARENIESAGFTFKALFTVRDLGIESD